MRSDTMTNQTSGPGLLNPRSQSERVLRWVQVGMAIGIVAIAALALTAGTGFSSWRVFTIGLLSALAAAAVGGALGFLFGLPISSRITVVNQSDPAAPRGTAQPSATASRPPERGDWFSDNTSMEQIADWLTKIIVGLALVQWGSLQLQFDRLAGAVTAAMMVPSTDATSASLRSAAVLLGGDAGRVPGGVILGAYAIFGFVLVYLWSRRYLSAELAAGRGDLLRNQRDAENAFLALAAQTGAVQEPQSGSDSAAAAAEATRVAEMGPASVPVLDFEQIVQPGPVPDDPWKRQFGGVSTDGHVEVGATVEEMQTQRGWYAIELFVRGVTTADRLQLRSTRARIYLHPTFPNAIRVNKFGASGRITVPLVCYEGFTVGVHLEDGRQFELDLTALPNVPEAFRGV